MVRGKNEGVLAGAPTPSTELTPGARFTPLTDVEADRASRAALEAEQAAHGRLTNLKRTLARSPVALRSLMAWHNLRHEVRSFLGERSTTVFAHAIAVQADCPVFSTFFRRLLIESGENPDVLQLNDRERAVVDYGRHLTANPNRVSDELYKRLAHFFEPPQIVALTALAGMIVATALFSNALRVELDERLQAYRLGGPR